MVGSKDETQKDIFLHVSELESSKLRVLKEEQKIIYDIKEEKDKLQAINIKIKKINFDINLTRVEQSDTTLSKSRQAHNLKVAGSNPAPQPND